MTTLAAADFYHTGIVVTDLESALAELTKLGGYRWTQVLDSPFTVWTESGEQVVRFQCVYSIDAPHLELVQAVPGTVWTPAPGNAVHHIGYFVDDLESSSQALSGAGLPLEACGSVDGQHPAVFAYHKGEDGIRIEIVDRAVFGDFGAFLRAMLDQAAT
jgi:catechol 2,3-dioxygenase-like lactoylglutathione lyase family enzyme